MFFRAFHRACGVHSKIHNRKTKGEQGFGPVQDSTTHIRRQSQPKLKDLATHHFTINNQNIQFHNHCKLQNNQEQEEKELESRTWN